MFSFSFLEPYRLAYSNFLHPQYNSEFIFYENSLQEQDILMLIPIGLQNKKID